MGRSRLDDKVFTSASDPRFVLDLRMGRIPRSHTAERIKHFMTKYEETAHVG